MYIKASSTEDPEAWDFAVMACICLSASGRPDVDILQCLFDSQNFKKRINDTDHRCKDRGFRFVPVIFDGHAGGWGEETKSLVQWIAQRLGATSLVAEADFSLEFAQRISSSLIRLSSGVILRREAPLDLFGIPVAQARAFGLRSFLGFLVFLRTSWYHARGNDYIYGLLVLEFVNICNFIFYFVTDVVCGLLSLWITSVFELSNVER